MSTTTNLWTPEKLLIRFHANKRDVYFPAFVIALKLTLENQHRDPFSEPQQWIYDQVGHAYHKSSLAVKKRMHDTIRVWWSRGARKVWKEFTLEDEEHAPGTLYFIDTLAGILQRHQGD